MNSKPSQYNYVPQSPVSESAVTRGLQKPNIVTLPSFSPPSQYDQTAQFTANQASIQVNAMARTGVSPRPLPSLSVKKDGKACSL